MTSPSRVTPARSLARAASTSCLVRLADALSDPANTSMLVSSKSWSWSGLVKKWSQPGTKRTSLGHAAGEISSNRQAASAADDLVLFPDQEDELARVLVEAGDNTSRADIPGGSDEQQPLRLVGGGQGGNRPCPCGKPQQAEFGTAMAAQGPGMSQGVINGPGQSIDGDLPIPIIPAGRVGESKDGSDPLGLEPFGEAAIAERMSQGEVAAFSVRGSVQPRVDDHEPRTSCRMSSKLHVRQSAALGAVGRATAVAVRAGRWCDSVRRQAAVGRGEQRPGEI